MERRNNQNGSDHLTVKCEESVLTLREKLFLFYKASRIPTFTNKVSTLIQTPDTIYDFSTTYSLAFENKLFVSIGQVCNNYEFFFLSVAKSLKLTKIYWSSLIL